MGHIKIKNVGFSLRNFKSIARLSVPTNFNAYVNSSSGCKSLLIHYDELPSERALKFNGQFYTPEGNVLFESTHFGRVLGIVDFVGYINKNLAKPIISATGLWLSLIKFKLNFKLDEFYLNIIDYSRNEPNYLNQLLTTEPVDIEETIRTIKYCFRMVFDVQHLLFETGYLGITLSSFQTPATPSVGSNSSLYNVYPLGTITQTNLKALSTYEVVQNIKLDSEIDIIENPEHLKNTDLAKVVRGAELSAIIKASKTLPLYTYNLVLKRSTSDILFYSLSKIHKALGVQV